MTQQTAAPYTVTDLTVPYGEKIAISTNGGGIVTIWYQTGPGVSPPGFYVHDRINNEEVLLGTFTAEQVVRIDTSGSPALYDIGASPSVGSGDADTLKGYSPDATDTADTVALRDGSGDIQANAFESTVATGTAPFTVASTTVVTNLNADLLDGQTGSYYATDSAVVHLTGTETIGGLKTFSSNFNLNNNVYFYGKETGGTARPILGVTTADKVQLNNTSLPLDIKSNGTLQYNGVTLASGTIDTTAAQTITVVDGLITAIV